MKLLCSIFLFFCFNLQAQYQVNGVVRDVLTKNPLAFANISSANINTISDIDGKFCIKLEKKTDDIMVSYIGYNKLKVNIDPNKKFYVLFLIPLVNPLEEVVLDQKENPALAIIRKVMENKDQNNPQKKLKSFEFKGYTKLVVTANPDSINDDLDSLFIKKKSKLIFSKIDSSNYKFKKLINKQHLFLTEKIAKYQFDKKVLKETVLATKMAGFKMPIYEISGLNLQSFSVYDNRYELFETKYKNPIATNPFQVYQFKILDSVRLQNRNTYLIYFKDKKKDNGLSGLLYIDQQNYAIAKAIMRVKGVLDITGIHEFNYIPEVELWFPKRKIFKIVKGINDEDIRILGETLKFDAEQTEQKNSRKKEASDYAYLLSETDFFEASYNLPIKIRHPNIAIEIKDNAINKEESYWQKYRKDSLDLRNIGTYTGLDSIVSKKGIEKKLRFGRKILNGYVPFGIVDLDPRYLVTYNNYEGFRLGLGGRTSEKFSKIIRIEGYTAYGAKDAVFKYSLGLATRIEKFSNSWIGLSYTDDLKEIASTSFAIDNPTFKLYDPRPFNVSTFYNFQTWRAYIETKIIPKTESIWEITHSKIEPQFDYIFNYRDRLYDNYKMTTAMLSIQWNPFSNYMQTPTGRIEIDKKFPKFTFQYTQALPDIANDFVFGKLDFRTEYEKKYLNGQKTALLFESGYTYGDVPLTHLYNTSPNNLNKESVIQRVTFAGKNSFETMYFNEFFSSEYAFFQIKHSSKRIELFKKIKPSLVLVSRMAWGNLKKPEQQIGINYKTLDKGYFESGLEINQIYNGLGLSASFRYGPYQLEKFVDNLAVKLTFIFNLGI